MTLVEMLLVISIALIFLGVGFFVYTKAKSSSQINAATQKVQTVIATIESLASNMGGNYPALSNVEMINDPFSPYLGRNKDTYRGIYYNCPAGVKSTITVKFPYSFFGSAKDAPDVCKAVALQIKQNTGWDATCDASGNLTITRAGSKCVTY